MTACNAIPRNTQRATLYRTTHNVQRYIAQHTTCNAIPRNGQRATIYRATHYLATLYRATHDSVQRYTAQHTTDSEQRYRTAQRTAAHTDARSDVRTTSRSALACQVCARKLIEVAATKTVAAAKSRPRA
jgi:hypothetical protein